MNRIVTYKNNEAILKAHSIIPKSILDRLHFDYLIGVDPVYAGLHNHIDTGDKRSYRDTAHVAYAHNQCLANRNKRTTIVIPKLLEPCHVVHEIAHVLDEYLGWEWEAIPITEYAKTDRLEAFAEAFTAWLFYNYATIPIKTQSEIDNKTLTLFESL